MCFLWPNRHRAVCLAVSDSLFSDNSKDSWLCSLSRFQSLYLCDRDQQHLPFNMTTMKLAKTGQNRITCYFRHRSPMYVHNYSTRSLNNASFTNQCLTQQSVNKVFLFYYLRTVGNACYDWGCSTDLMMPSQVYIAVDSENQTQVSK